MVKAQLIYKQLFGAITAKNYFDVKFNLANDKIGDVSFKISPQSFFQINSLQTPRLYDLAIQKADLKPDDVVIDAYSGIGTIGLSVAKHVKAVRGMEVIEPAVEDANANAKLNGITNAEYVVGKAEEVMPRWAMSGLMVRLPRRLLLLS